MKLLCCIWLVVDVIYVNDARSNKYQKSNIHEEQYKFVCFAYSQQYSKIVQKSKHTFYIHNFLFENRALYEITWKNLADKSRLQMTIWRMRTACWILKATNTHSEYVTFIASPQRQRLHEGASMLTSHVHCWLVTFIMSHSAVLPEQRRLLYPIKYCSNILYKTALLTFRRITSTIVDVPHR